MKQDFEIVIEGNDNYKLKIEAIDMKDAIEKFKNLINFCYEKEIFFNELEDEDIETLDEDNFVFDEEIDDLDELYDNKIISILFESNKPKKAIIVDFE